MTFDIQLARELACAFSSATGLGCSVTAAPSGDTLCEFGYSCASCALCRALGTDRAACARGHLYGMAEAERFGGRYIYFCNRGLTFFVSPIIGRERGEARVTAGPFLMVDPADFCACELGGDQQYDELVRQLPFVAPEKVTQLSTLLFMTVGFLNNVAGTEAMREREASVLIQGQISAYILEVKQSEKAPPYPYDKERALINAMIEGAREEAGRLLNELLGHILVTSGASFERAKAYINALLVVLSRAVIKQGGTGIEERALGYFERLQTLGDMPALCLWLTGVVNELMSEMYEFRDARHADALHRCIQYVRTHLDSKLDLEELSRVALLSPAYFSRVCKSETGRTVQEFVMEARLSKSRELIRYENMKLSDIAQLAGFQDQSYFSRAFKKRYGQSPQEYRRAAKKQL